MLMRMADTYRSEDGVIACQRICMQEISEIRTLNTSCEKILWLDTK
jgi:hypothetical protein